MPNFSFASQGTIFYKKLNVDWYAQVASVSMCFRVEEQGAYSGIMPVPNNEEEDEAAAAFILLLPTKQHKSTSEL